MYLGRSSGNLLIHSLPSLAIVHHPSFVYASCQVALPPSAQPGLPEHLLLTTLTAEIETQLPVDRHTSFRRLEKDRDGRCRSIRERDDFADEC